MDIQTAVQTVIGKYADFNGRARRSEYWYWYLAVVGVYVVLFVLSQVSGLLTALLFLFALAVIIPTLAAGVRRLHDIGKPGVYILFGLIPLVGAILLIVWFAQDSQPGANQYGPNPKALAYGGY